MLSDLLAVCTGLPASLTWTVKLNVPVALGVPVIVPLLGLSVRPGGNVPLVRDHVYGVAVAASTSARVASRARLSTLPLCQQRRRMVEPAEVEAAWSTWPRC